MSKPHFTTRMRDRIGPGVAAAMLLVSGGAAQALSFTAPSEFHYSGNVSFLTPPNGVDTNTGFVLRGDYQIGSGMSFLILNRAFQIGPLPERIDSVASENFKIVVSGGGSGAPSGASFAADVFYRILPVPLGPVSPGSAAGGHALVVDNGLVVHDLAITAPLAPVLPTAGILSPGSYSLETYIRLDFQPGAPAAFPLAAFIELGGLSAFGGVQLGIAGTPVPEPAPAALLGAGLAALAWRRRVSSTSR